MCLQEEVMGKDSREGSVTSQAPSANLGNTLTFTQALCVLWQQFNFFLNTYNMHRFINHYVIYE